MFIDVPFRLVKIATFITVVPPQSYFLRPCVRQLRWCCIRLLGNGLWTRTRDHKHSTHKNVILGMFIMVGLKMVKT